MNIQRFESRRQVVEAVQLTADADWQAIAQWCGGEVCECGEEMYVPNADFEPVVDDWVIRIDADTFTAETEGEFPKGFQPVPDLEGVAGEIRQALEDVTPDGVEMTAFVYESIFGPTVEIEMPDADRALIAAAPELLARSLVRIEQLEAWKESATRILGAWDEVWVALGQPGSLGASKAAASLVAIAKEDAPRTAAERYFTERLTDPEYRAAYEAAREAIAKEGA